MADLCTCLGDKTSSAACGIGTRSAAVQSPYVKPGQPNGH